MKKKLFMNQMIDSVKNFDAYKEISNQKLSQSFKYFFILIFIYSFVVTAGATYSVRAKILNIQNIVKNEIMELNYNEGELSVNNGEIASYYDNKIVVDTSDSTDINSNSNIQVLIRKSSLFVRSDENVVELPYKMFFNQNFNKETLVEGLNIDNYIGIIIVITFICSFVILTIATIIDVLVIALIGFIISRLVGNNRLEYKSTFNMAVHAITLSVLLGMIYFVINIFTGFKVKYFQFMYDILPMIYMVTAILLLNSNKSDDKLVRWREIDKWVQRMIRKRKITKESI